MAYYTHRYYKRQHGFPICQLPLPLLLQLLLQHSPFTTHYSPLQSGISTVFTTWITPLLWFTSAMVIHDLPPFSSTRYNFLPCAITINVPPSTVFNSAFPLPAFTLAQRSPELMRPATTW